jgi:UTP--glucose-1-phosphate uridylyltransferase
VTGAAQPARRPVRKAVIPAAGFGTRFLPATKTMPKEMLPIVDKPVLQFVVEEAVHSGICDICIITGRGKRAIEDHFDANPELEAFLRDAGKADLAEQIGGVGEGVRIFYIRQKRQLGLGDAIRLAREHVNGEPFAVLLGDTIIDPPAGERPGLRQVMEAYERKGGNVVAVEPVPRALTSRYGIVDGRAEPDAAEIAKLTRLVEKPAPETAPSNLAIAGRYVFSASIFDCIDATPTGVGGEIQLTDAMNLLAQREPFYALTWRARRYDIGNRVEYAKCFIDFALRRKDTAAAVREYLAATTPAGA